MKVGGVCCSSYCCSSPPPPPSSMPPSNASHLRRIVSCRQGELGQLGSHALDFSRLTGPTPCRYDTTPRQQNRTFCTRSWEGLGSRITVVCRRLCLRASSTCHFNTLCLVLCIADRLCFSWTDTMLTSGLSQASTQGESRSHDSSPEMQSRMTGICLDLRIS